MLNFFYRNCPSCFVRKYLWKLRYTYSLHRSKPNLRSKSIYFYVGANRTFPIFYISIFLTEKYNFCSKMILFDLFSVYPMHNRYGKMQIPYPTDKWHNNVSLKGFPITNCCCQKTRQSDNWTKMDHILCFCNFTWCLYDDSDPNI